MSWGLGQFSGCLFVLSRRLHLSWGRVGEDDVDGSIWLVAVSVDMKIKV
jgi:hypothetical protein